MRKICLYPHPTSLNRGCEAIATSTAEILDKYCPNSKRILFTILKNDDPENDIDLISKLYDLKTLPLPTIKRFSPIWFKYQFCRAFKIKCNISKSLGQEFLKNNRQELIDKDVFLSIGGDNYCYGKPRQYYATNLALNLINKKSILFGCSIEPSAIDYDMLEDLKRYKLIIARESITYDALKNHKIDNVVLYPDPAFTLKTESVDDTIIPENTVGLNISPMILEYSNDSNRLKKAYDLLINYILNNTDLNIALIPHVSLDCTSDVNTLTEVKARYCDNERVILVGDHNCLQQKYLISKCRLFVGARTHATIAAYSTCVPTLVTGYSVKSLGIAKDLFGTNENYVIPVQNIDSKNILVDKFKWLLENENNIRQQLQGIMPSYIEKANQVGNEIKKILEN